MVFHWSVSDSKSPQVSRTLLSIRADLNNAVVWMVSTHPLIFKHWSWSWATASDSKSPQVSRTLLSILADLRNALVWMISSCPLISTSSSPSTNPLLIITSAPIITGITVTLMLQSFFSSQAMTNNLSLFSLSFSFSRWSAGTANSIIW